MYDKSDEINEGTKIEKFEIRDKIEDILFKIVSSPKFVPLATAFALSTLGITLSLSSGDHSHFAFAASCDHSHFAFAASCDHSQSAAMHPPTTPGGCIGICENVEVMSTLDSLRTTIFTP